MSPQASTTARPLYWVYSPELESLAMTSITPSTTSPQPSSSTSSQARSTALMVFIMSRPFS